MSWLLLGFIILFFGAFIYGSSKVISELSIKIQENLYLFLVGLFIFSGIVSLLYFIYLGLEINPPTRFKSISFLPINHFAFYFTSNSGLLNYKNLLNYSFFIGITISYIYIDLNFYNPCYKACNFY